jgi:hypothetical protein
VSIRYCGNVFTETFLAAAVYSYLLRNCRLTTDVVPLFLSRPLPRNKSIRHSIIYIACQCSKHLSSKTVLHKIQFFLPVSPSRNYALTPWLYGPLKTSTPFEIDAHSCIISAFALRLPAMSMWAFPCFKNFPSHSGLLHFNHSSILPSSAFSSRSVLSPHADQLGLARHAHSTN